MLNTKVENNLENHDLVTQNTVKVEALKKTLKQPTNLPAEIFQVQVNNQAIFDTIMSERASQRQGTHKVKDRSEVRGGGKKPWRQKGTGRARAGSIRSPIWVGGGTVFGPQTNRNYQLKVNKKVRHLALNSALTLQAQHGQILSYEFNLSTPSTKTLLQQLKDLELSNLRRLLIVSDNPAVYKSAQNVQSIHVNKWNSLHVEDIINAEILIIAPKILESLSHSKTKKIAKQTKVVK